jgi:hypothetical protein
MKAVCPSSVRGPCGLVVLCGLRRLSSVRGVAPDFELHCARVNDSAAKLFLKPVVSVGTWIKLAGEGISKFNQSTALYIHPTAPCPSTPKLAASIPTIRAFSTPGSIGQRRRTRPSNIFMGYSKIEPVARIDDRSLASPLCAQARRLYWSSHIHGRRIYLKICMLFRVHIFHVRRCMARQ